jgi:hypothetical protein
MNRFTKLLVLAGLGRYGNQRDVSPSQFANLPPVLASEVYSFHNPWFLLRMCHIGIWLYAFQVRV